MVFTAKNDMSTIIMIGNGFDIAAGLNSKYSDFINYKWGINNELYERTSYVIRSNLPPSQYISKNNLNNIAVFFKQENISFWEYHLIINNRNVDDNRTWIGFEDDIFKFLEIVKNNIDYLRDDKPGFNLPRKTQEDIKKHDMLFNTLYLLKAILYNEVIHDKPRKKVMEKEIYNILLEQLKHLENKFKTYMDNEVKVSKIYESNTDVILNEMFEDKEIYFENIFLLNFNYTLPKPKIITERFKHINIHGSIKDNIIFGIDDTSLEINNKNKDYRFLFTKAYRKMEEKITLGDENFYFDKKLMESIRTIKIFGLSLGESDYVYFQTIFDSIDIYNSEVVLEFYYNEYRLGANQHKEIAEKAYLLIKDHSTNKDVKSPLKDKSLLNKLLLENRIKIVELNLTKKLFKLQK